MKLRNRSKLWSDAFLRRMVSWTAKQLGLPVRKIREAQFGRRSHGCWNGSCSPWRGKIRVVLGPERAYPVAGHLYPGRTSEAFRSPGANDITEGLILVTAHELQHIVDFLQKRPVYGERRTRHAERVIIEAFRANRDELLAKWSAADSRSSKPRPTRQEQNERKARAALERWERKLKLAKTKVSDYRAKCRRYDRIAANKNS